MKKIYLIILSCTLFVAFASDIDFDFDGESRIRGVYSTENEDLNIDLRSQLSLKISGDSGFYQKTALELGNIDLDSNLTVSSFYEIETKELFFGYKSDFIKGKLGIIELDTIGSIYSGEDLGLQIKVNTEFMDFKGFYTLQNIVSDTWDFLDDFRNLNHLIYLSAEYEEIPDTDLSALVSYFVDQDKSYNSYWIGSEIIKEYEQLELKAGIIYNGGSVISNNSSISSWLLYTDLELELDKSSEISTRFNFLGNINDSGTINQFQFVDGDGDINSNLSLLVEQVLDMDNLSTNDALYINSTIFFYEIEYSREFNSIPLNSVITLGGVSEGEYIIGLEVDIDNKFELLENLNLNLDMAYLLKSGDDNFEIDLNIEYSY